MPAHRRGVAAPDPLASALILAETAHDLPSVLLAFRDLARAWLDGGDAVAAADGLAVSVCEAFGRIVPVDPAGLAPPDLADVLAAHLEAARDTLDELVATARDEEGWGFFGDEVAQLETFSAELRTAAARERGGPLDRDIAQDQHDLELVGPIERLSSVIERDEDAVSALAVWLARGGRWDPATGPLDQRAWTDAAVQLGILVAQAVDAAGARCPDLGRLHRLGDETHRAMLRALGTGPFPGRYDPAPTELADLMGSLGGHVAAFPVAAASTMLRAFAGGAGLAPDDRTWDAADARRAAALVARGTPAARRAALAAFPALDDAAGQGWAASALAHLLGRCAADAAVGALPWDVTA